MSAIFTTRMEISEREVRRDLLYAFLAAEALDEADFSDKVLFHIERDLIPDEITVVVREPSFKRVEAQFKTSPTLGALLKRIQDRATISVRSFDANGAESSRAVIQGNAPLEIDRERLVRGTITKLVRARNGFVVAAGSYHFELPSQRHTQRFLRISNMFVDAAEISFIASCLLPYVDDKLKVVYIDTPALFPVVAALSDHLRAFFPWRSPVVAENFRSYGGVSSFSFSAEPENLVLISASSSGRLAKEILKSAQFEAGQMLHLLFSGKEEEQANVICNIYYDEVLNPDGYKELPEDYSAGACPLCAQHSPAVQLVGDHFELPGPQPTPLVFGIADINPRFPDLMRRAVGRQLLRVGFGRSNQTTVARQFEVSPKILIEMLRDTGRLAYVLNQIVPAGLGTIVYLDELSEELATLVEQHAGGRVGAGKRPTLMAAKELAALATDPRDEAVLVVATVIESGRSLQDVSRDLRRPFPKAPQVYLVGLAKFLSEALFQRLKTNLTQTLAVVPHQFVAIERMQLPSSSEVNAWVQERQLLSDPGFYSDMATEEQDDWRQRVERLRNQAEPLIDDLFISARGEAPIRLQSGFALWPSGLAEKGSQADVFFTIASIMQNLRAKEAEEGAGRALRSDLFQHTLIDPGNFGRFSDGIIQASFLRAAHPNELNYSTSPRDSRQMARYARRILESADVPRGEAASELLIAMATKRLRLMQPDAREVLADISGAPPRVERLCKIVRRVLDL